MDRVALLTSRDRGALFRETAAGRGVADTIIEKDFWVCWCLRRLFGLPNRNTLVFKGGTSLSKAFGAIRRFSEDIDLSFDRAELGYVGDRDPEQEGIGTRQADRLIEDLLRDVVGHIAGQLLPALRDSMTEQFGEQADGKWTLEIDNKDAQTVNFRYPTALSAVGYERMSYITPRVKLEFGARGDPWPTETRVIRPYAADDYPDFFEQPDTWVTVLSARRTFWEKATALHAEAHRPAERPTPPYFSRHYYDLAMLLETTEGQAATADLEMLARVAKHKATFFRSSWASYDTAQPGTMRLIPDEARIKDLRGDYRSMEPMIFDEAPPSFDDIVARIATLQRAINK